MNRRDLLWLFGIALVVRGLAAWVVDYPPYTDAAYYALVAQQLADGQGFSVPVLWSFLEVGGSLPADPMLPVTAHGHWMPLSSLVAAPFVWALGDVLGDWRAAQVPSVLLSAALVPFTYLVGWELWRSRRVAMGGAILALLAGPLLIYYPTPATFTAFGVCGAVAIWAAIRAVRAPHPGWWLVASGAAVGLATLARVEGPMLALAPATAWLLRRDWAPIGPRLAWGFASAAAFALVLGPWLLRNAAIYGAAFPSAGGHTLWITSYNEQFSIGTDPTLARFLDWGVANIVGSRLAAWGEMLGRVAVLLGGLFVLPFLYGMWVERRRRELAPFLVYLVVAFVVMGAFFAFHAPRGLFYHSAPAWLPFAFPLAVASLPGAASAAGRWWRFLRRPATHRFLLVAGLGGALALSLIGSAVVWREWSVRHERLAAAADFLRSAADPDDRVMAYDPAAFHPLSGLAGVAPPFDPFPIVGQVVDAYDVRWVVVPLALGESRDPLGLWDGASAVDVAGNHPAFLPEEPAFEAPGIRVYEVVR